MRTDAGAQRSLDAAYVTEHLQHAYALTAHTIQGGTVEWAGVVGHPDDFTRNWSYTALSRARDPTETIPHRRPNRARARPRRRSRPTSPPNFATSELPSNASTPPCAAATTRTSPSTASTHPPATRPHPHTDQPRHRERAQPAATRPAAHRTRAAPRTDRPLPRTPRRPAPRRTQRAQRGAARRRPSSRAGRGTRAARTRPLAPSHRRSYGARLRARAPKARREPRSDGGRARARPRAPRARPRRLADRPPSAARACRRARKRSSRPCAASTSTTRWNTQPRTCSRHSVSLPISRARGEPGGKPPNASRPTASTTPSPTTATRWAHDPPRHPHASTGSEPSTTSSEPSTSWGSALNAASAVSSDRSDNGLAGTCSAEIERRRRRGHSTRRRDRGMAPGARQPATTSLKSPTPGPLPTHVQLRRFARARQRGIRR